jgi:hypothetical protein
MRCFHMVETKKQRKLENSLKDANKNSISNKKHNAKDGKTTPTNRYKKWCIPNEMH